MVASFSPLSDDDAGVSQTVQTLNSLAIFYGRLPAVRAAALRIIGRVADDDQRAHVDALAAFVRDAVQFVRDPQNAEFIQTPDVMLLAIHRTGAAQGDCDDHCELFASLCQSVGVPAEIIAVRSPDSSRLDHVQVLAHLDTGDEIFDLTQK